MNKIVCSIRPFDCLYSNLVISGDEQEHLCGLISTNCKHAVKTTKQIRKEKLIKINEIKKV